MLFQGIREPTCPCTPIHEAGMDTGSGYLRKQLAKVGSYRYVLQAVLLEKPGRFNRKDGQD